MFVYRPLELDQAPGRFEVGFFCPAGAFTAVSYEDTAAGAQHKVHFLNGGQHPKVVESLHYIAASLSTIESSVRRAEAAN
ncbi:hypothetical protein AN933_22415 [Mycobacterium intracellulare subsp. chimaera]|nr:hypothetical protein AN933_22415 [Mycobacterium intracellulare subsp. chimaera]